MYVNCSSEVFPSCPDTARPAELFTGDQATIALFNNARIATPALRGCIKGFRKAGRRTRHDRGFRRLSRWMQSATENREGREIHLKASGRQISTARVGKVAGQRVVERCEAGASSELLMILERPADFLS